MADAAECSVLEIKSEISPVRVIPIAKRTVIVLHFLVKGETPFINTNKYCNLQTSLKFKLSYFPTKNYMDAGTVLENITENDMLIIYFNTETEKHDVEEKPKFFNFLIENIKRLGEIQTLIFYTAHSLPGITSIFLLQNDLENYLRTVPKLYSEIIKANVKIYNISYESHYKGPTKTFTFQDVLVIRRMPLTRKEIENRVLECQWWFNEEILNAFGCGRGRLIQLSGTCYLTSAVNGLILSDNARALCIESMNLHAKRNAALKSSIKKPICEMACPSFSAGRKEFFYNILYNTACLSSRDLPECLDVFIHASAKLFCGNPSITDPKIKDYGQGGSTLSALMNLVFEMDINAFLLLNTSKPDIQVQKLAFINPKESYTDISQKLMNDAYSTQLPSELVDAFKKRKCLLYLPQIPTDVEKSDVPVQLKQDENNFVLCFGCISFSGVQKDGKTMWHAVLGLICNEIFVIYDSNLNRFIDFDWTNMKENQDKIASVFSDLYEGQLSLLKNFYVDIAFYVNEKQLEKPKATCDL